MEYNITIIEDEILPFTTTWKKLKEVILSEMNQNENKYQVISLLNGI